MYGILEAMARLFDVQVTGDLAGVIKMPRVLELTTARAIDNTGKFAQEEVIRELDDEFVLRGNWFRPKTRYGVNFIATQKGNLEGKLYTRADWLLEEEGFNRGIKKPEDGKHLADPEDPVTRGPITAKFPVAQKAKRLLANSRGRISPKTGRLIGSTGAFIIQPKSNPDIQLIFQRVGTNKQGEIKRSKKGVPLRGRVKGKPSKLILKHVLKKQVRVPTPRVLQNTTINTYRTWYPINFNRSLIFGLRTAKF